MIGKLKNRLGIQTRLLKILLVLIFLACAGLILSRSPLLGNVAFLRYEAKNHKPKLIWLIPDGLRAEPDVFKIYEWASQGHLPNIKFLMENGMYGYSIPVFPGHTPANFATLFTGLLPKDHGVSDGPIRLAGYPVKMAPISGFSSTAKMKDPIWFTLEKMGLRSTLLTVPGSTPPEISNGNIVKGRWGGWGIEFPSVVFHSAEDVAFRKELGLNDRAFNVGKRLTLFVHAEAPRDWHIALPQSFSPPQEISMKNWDANLFALLIDSTDDQVKNYDRVYFSKDKSDLIANIKEGEWSEWLDLTFSYPIQRAYQDESPQKSKLEQDLTSISMPTKVKVRAEKLGDGHAFRFRVLYDTLNPSLTLPMALSDRLHESVGPMVDFPDDFPPQLIYFDEDKQTFLDEVRMSFDWHTRAVDFFLQNEAQDILIHNIYTPNQMLTSRWWMGIADPQSIYYSPPESAQSKQTWEDILSMYKKIDTLIGVALKGLDSDGYFVFSSDHGIAPLNFEVRLNNLFAKRGWLKFETGQADRAYRIDWKKTKVVFLQSNHVFISTSGLDGPYSPGAGAEYEALRAAVLQAVSSLQDSNGQKPFLNVYKRDEAEENLGLPPARIGDLVLVHNLGYSAVEDITDGSNIFHKALRSGYKQGLNPGATRSLWTPFMAMGPGIRKGYALKEPISHLDQYPFIFRLLNKENSIPLKNTEILEGIQ